MFGGVWTLKVWAMEAMECLKLCLIDHTRRSMKDSGIECYLNSGVLAQDFSGKKNCILFTRDHSCLILMNTVAVFCSCLKSLP